MPAIQKFKVDYQGMAAEVVEHDVKGTHVFHIVFAQPRIKPLVITLAEQADGGSFWTSVPEGRQDEAEEVGLLIDNVSSNQKEVCVIITAKKLRAPSLFD